MSWRPSLLMLTAAAAASAAVANGITAASPDQAAHKTRLGVSVDQELGERDQAAIRRKRALDLREQAARATEARLKVQLEAQQQPPQTAAQMRGGAAAGPEETDQYNDLARIYQAMKPAKAAVVLEQLDLDVQMKVTQKMRERSAALILASMTPKGAATLSTALVRRSPLRTRPSPPLTPR